MKLWRRFRASFSSGSQRTTQLGLLRAKIIVWKDSHLEIAREAVAEIDRLAERAMRRYGGSSSFLLSWDREITLQEVER